MTWNLVTSESLNQDLLNDLFENRIGAVRIPEFLDETTARSAVEGISKHGFDYYAGVNPPIRKIGITQFEHRSGAGAREEYFRLACKADERRREVFAESGDLVDRVIRAVAVAWHGEVRIAAEPEGLQYFAGLVRVIHEGLLHCDWAPFDAPSPTWSIGAVNAQITWNIYCQLPADGGATVVYNHPWTSDAEAHRIPGSYGYAERFVEGCESVRIKPRARDLVFFNSRNFHRIEPGTGAERLSVSSFIGRHADCSLALWS